MDNLTHSLAGAVLGQMGLKHKTGLAMPALIIGANIPDIDAVATLLPGVEHLAIRRGVTHGPIALVILPLILTALLLAWNRWRPDPNRASIHIGWLLALGFIGTLSHPALDWLNSYGIRFLEPFSSQWFAGDTLFIIDVWVWTALAFAVWLSRRRERVGRSDWRHPAIAGFGVVCAYIAANGLITGKAESQTLAKIRESYDPIASIPDPMVVASPVPVMFWRREVLWRDASHHGSGQFQLPNSLVLSGDPAPNTVTPNLTKAAVHFNSDARAFLFWSRMPVARLDGADLVLTDQRFSDPRVASRFQVRVPLKDLK